MPDQQIERLRIDRTETSAGRRGRLRRFFPWLVLASVLAAGGLLYVSGLIRPALEVPVATVASYYPSQAYTLLNASGYVVAQRKAAVASKVTSQLVALEVEEGSRVRAGQLIARLENEDTLAARDRAKAEVDVARATVAQTNAELRDAELNYQRNKALVAKGLAARSVYDAAEARYQTALAGVATSQASLRAAEAALAEAEVQISYTYIRAPFDGVVLTKDADVGDIVTPLGAAANARASVVTLANLDSLQVEADVSEANIESVAVGQPCEIRLDAFPVSRFRGRVHMIVPTADRSKGSVMVKVAFLDKSPRILPEMSAKVAFLDKAIDPAEQKPVTAVLAKALVETEGRTTAYVVRGDRALQLPVKVGRRFGDMTEVISGLKVGDRVVAEPSVRLRDGSRVRMLE